jgi:hypothetical protein
LLAQDADDLTVLSAALQDAIVRVGDIRFEPARRTLTLAVNRYCWESGVSGGVSGGARVRSVLQFGDVLGVRSRNLRRDASDAVISILSLEFLPGDPPGGVLSIILAGGGDIQADLECIDSALSDVSDSWPARSEPKHEEP